MDNVTKDKALVKAKPKALTKRKRKSPTELGRQLLKDLHGYVIDQKALLTFIKDSLVENVDYGYSWKGAAKKNIYKAGCEKVRIFMRCLDKPFLDRSAWEMMGSPANTLPFVVYLVPMSRMKIVHQYIREYGVENEELAWRENSVSVGRGAASTAEGMVVKDANVMLKKGKKRAFMDAVLNLGLSGEFETPPEDDDNGQEEEQPRALPEEKEEIPPKETAAAAKQNETSKKDEETTRLKDVANEVRKMIMDNVQEKGGPYTPKGAEFLYHQAKSLFKSKDLEGLKRQKMTIENIVKSFRNSREGREANG